MRPQMTWHPNENAWHCVYGRISVSAPSADEALRLMQMAREVWP